MVSLSVSSKWCWFVFISPVSGAGSRLYYISFKYYEIWIIGATLLVFIRVTAF